MNKTFANKLHIAQLTLILVVLCVAFEAANAQESEATINAQITDLTSKIAAAPNDDKLYVQRGTALMQAQRYDEALADAAKALQLNPKNYQAILLRGNVKYEKKDYDGAIADYSAVINPSYQYSDAYFWRGRAFEGKGENEKAVADYKKAGEMNPVLANMMAGYRQRLEAKMRETPKSSSGNPATNTTTAAPEETETEKLMRQYGIPMTPEKRAEIEKQSAQMTKGISKSSENTAQVVEAFKNMKPRSAAENKMLELVVRENEVKNKYRVFKAAYAKTSDVTQQIALLDRIKIEHQTALTELENVEKQNLSISPDDKKLLAEIKTGYSQSLNLINGMIAGKQPTATSPIEEVARYMTDLKRTMTNAGYRVVAEGVADKARPFANGSSSRLAINASSNLHFVLFVISDDPTYDTFFYLNGQFMNTPVRMSGYYVKSPLVKKLSDTYSLFSFNMGFNNEKRDVAAEFRGDKPGKINYILMQLPENPQ